jgi:hypothetical protein
MAVFSALLLLSSFRFVAADDVNSYLTSLLEGPSGITFSGVPSGIPTSILADTAAIHTPLTTTSSYAVASTSITAPSGLTESTRLPVSTESTAQPTSGIPTTGSTISNGTQSNSNTESVQSYSTPPTVWVGVAVGVGLTLLFIIGALAYALWRRRKASSKTRLPAYDPATGYEYRAQIGELSGSDSQGITRQHRKSESVTSVYHEADGGLAYHEVDGQRPVGELP